MAIPFLIPSLVLASSDGPRFSGTGTNDTSFGTTAWSSPGNILAHDSSYATCGSANGVDSNYLEGTNFGFAIPSNAVITGIVVEWDRKGVCTGCVFDSRVRIIKGGVVGSSDKSSGSGWDISQSYNSYGGPGDLWGLTWNASDINASNFGAALAINPHSSGTTASVDNVRITVYYSPPSSGWEEELIQ